MTAGTSVTRSRRRTPAERARADKEAISRHDDTLPELWRFLLYAGLLLISLWPVIDPMLVQPPLRRHGYPRGEMSGPGRDRTFMRRKRMVGDVRTVLRAHMGASGTASLITPTIRRRFLISGSRRHFNQHLQKGRRPSVRDCRRMGVHAALHDFESLPPTMLAERMEMMKGAITRLAERLVDKGLVGRSPIPITGTRRCWRSRQGDDRWFRSLRKSRTRTMQNSSACCRLAIAAIFGRTAETHVELFP